MLETIQISFEADKDHFWGAHMNLEDATWTWSVNEIEEGSQFHEKQVQKGWMLHKVNGMIVEKARKAEIASILKEGQACDITFRIVALAKLF